MSFYTKYNQENAATTLNTSLENAATLAVNLTDIACSVVVNVAKEDGNVAMAGFLFNAANNSKHAPKVQKLINTFKSFVSSHIAMTAKKEKGSICKDSEGNVIYKKSEKKYVELVAKASKAGYEKDEMVAYVEFIMETELKELGGTILGAKAKAAPKTKAEKEAAKVKSWDSACKNGFANLTVAELKKSLEEHGILKAIADLEAFQAELDKKEA